MSSIKRCFNFLVKVNQTQTEVLGLILLCHLASWLITLYFLLYWSSDTLQYYNDLVLQNVLPENVTFPLKLRIDGWKCEMWATQWKTTTASLLIRKKQGTLGEPSMEVSAYIENWSLETSHAKKWTLLWSLKLSCWLYFPYTCLCPSFRLEQICRGNMLLSQNKL